MNRPIKTSREGGPKPSLMVLGGEHRNALDLVRNLGRLGIPLFVGGNSMLARSLYSRFPTERFVYPPAREGLEVAHAAIIARVRELRPDVLLPTMDDSWNIVRTFSEEYRELTRVVPFPPNELFEIVINKGSMTRRAQELGVDTPRSFFPRPGNPTSAMDHGLAYPVLTKPLSGVEGKGIQIAGNPEELESAVRGLDHPFLVQEFIDGQDLDLTILSFKGEPVAGSAYINLRNAPLPYGPPMACRTIDDDELMASGIKLLRGLRYHGIAHLDYRRDRRDGKPKLLDFNARLAGTTEVSVRGGVDFPLLLYRLALGEQVEPRFKHSRNLEFRWVLFGEIRHWFETPHKIKVAREYLKWKNVSTNVSLTDPIPHLAHLLGKLVT